VAVASAGPYANHLHLARASTSPLSFYRPSCRLTNYVKALKNMFHSSSIVVVN